MSHTKNCDTDLGSKLSRLIHVMRKISFTAANSAHFQACCRTFFTAHHFEHFTYLCVVNFECAARRINVAAIEILTCTRCRVDRIKLDHCLYAILLEYHNAKHLAVRMTDCVNYLLRSNEKKFSFQLNRNKIL